MTDESNVVEPERYAFEKGTMGLYGSVTDRGDGRCTVRASFEETSTGQIQKFEFRSVARNLLADLLRSFADNIAPVQDGAYTFWCDLHVTELEGPPTLVRDEATNAWNLDLDQMECPHSHGTACRPSWRMGLVSVEDTKEVAE
ncbi:hypothetical protein [Amycolatopsis anabasis]|uniref:hypothetical protein n=1 Tax=Amycolatopsis anabasis TaxID=1840409 RepID=UPI00131A7B26|nr:hypothetical protein [Amycolatopsis anabasis]